MAKHTVFLGVLDKWPSDDDLDHLHALNENLGRGLIFPFLLRGARRKLAGNTDNMPDEKERCDFASLVTVNERFARASMQGSASFSIAIKGTLLVSDTRLTALRTEASLTELPVTENSIKERSLPVEGAENGEFICLVADRSWTVIPVSDSSITSPVGKAVASISRIYATDWLPSSYLFRAKISDQVAFLSDVTIADVKFLNFDDAAWDRYFTGCAEHATNVDLRSRIGVSVNSDLAKRHSTFIAKLLMHKYILNADFDMRRGYADDYLKVAAAVCDLQGRPSPGLKFEQSDFSQVRVLYHWLPRARVGTISSLGVETAWEQLGRQEDDSESLATDETWNVNEFDFEDFGDDPTDFFGSEPFISQTLAAAADGSD